MMLRLCLVNGYSFTNILRVFQLAGVPAEIVIKFEEEEPRGSKTSLVKETLKLVSSLREDEANMVFREIIEDVLIHKSHGPQYREEKDYLRALAKLPRFLRLDGFDIGHDGLVRSMPREITQEETVLEKALSRLGFELVIHHLNRSYEHYGDGQWDSANGQTRKVLEAQTRLIAEKIAQAKKESIPHRFKDPRPTEIRGYLKNVGFLNNEEFELLSSFYGYASVKGGHPGLSDETDARIRRIIVVGLCQFYLEKLQAFL